jgi:hypothetical protein
MQVLLQYALSLPETEDGIACAGTALESITVKTKKKAFLFIRATEARLKLADSQKEAAAMAARQPETYSVGANGWVLIRFEGPAAYPLDVLKRWVHESYSLCANSKVSAAKSKAPTPKLKRKPGK